MLLICLLGDYPVWIVSWILMAIGYYLVLKRMGLSKWACVIPFLAERELSKVLFQRLRSFYRPFVVALVLLIFGLYLGTGEDLGFAYMFLAVLVYGIFQLRLYWRLRKSFGRGFIFYLALILLPPLFLIILGTGKKSYAPLPLKPIRDHGKLGNAIRKGALVLVSAAEILVLVVGVGFFAIQSLPPELLVNYQLSDFHDKTKDIQGDGEVVSREDAMGKAAGAVAAMKPSREPFFPDHSRDQSVAVLTYVIGSNLEHKGGLASANIKQMVDATKQGDNLTFVMEAGGTKRWFTRGIENSSCARYEIRGGELTKKEDLPDDLCMSESESLLDFLNWAKKNYKADRYMLVLWDHGGGVPYGYGRDDLNKRDSDEDISTLMTSEVVDAIGKSGMKFDVIGFDACLMQDIEIAAAMEPYTDYYLASEEIEGGYGWFYTSSFGKLAQDPGLSTEEFAVDMLSCYDQMNTVVKDDDGKPDTKATLSLVDTRLAKPAYDELAGLMGKMDEAIREDSGAFASTAVAGANAYSFQDDMQIDLIDYLKILKKTDYENDICSDKELTDLIRRIQACVLYRNKDSAKGISGMAFAFPYKAIEMYGDTSKQLKAMSLNTERKTFDDIFSIIAVQKKRAMEDENYMDNLPATGDEEADPLTTLLESIAPTDYTDSDWYVKGFEDYDTSTALVDIPLKETPEGYAIQLPEKTWKIIADCQTMVYQDAPDGNEGDWVYLGMDYLGGEDDKGHPLLAMDGSWIHINGNPVCYEADPVRETADGDVYSGKVPARLNNEEDVILNIEWDPIKEGVDAVEGHVTGYETTDEGILSGVLDTKGTLNLKAGDTIQFLFETYDAEGNLVSMEPSGDKIRVTKQNRLKVEDLPLGEEPIHFCGVLTDVYQRVMYTEMLDLE